MKRMMVHGLVGSTVSGLLLFNGCNRLDTEGSATTSTGNSTATTVPEGALLAEPPGASTPLIEPVAAESGPQIYVNTAMQSLHARSERRFLQATGFGISRTYFMPLNSPDAILAMKDKSEWRIYKREFLGIAEHAEPTVMSSFAMVELAHRSGRRYSSLDLEGVKEEMASGEIVPMSTQEIVDAERTQQHPLEDTRKTVRERPLNAFETAVMARMLTSKETGPWMAEAPDRGEGCYRLLGAIRAQERCLKCHSDYKVGDPLGAFVYLLEQVTPAEETSGEEVPEGQLLGQVVLHH